MAELSYLFSEGLRVTSGVDLLDSDNNFIKEIGANFKPEGSSVRRTSIMTLHGTAKLNIAEKLNWENQRLRPWIVLEDLYTDESERWNLGVYLPEVPKRTAMDDPQVYAVDCYDVLSVLNVPHGVSYSVSAGTSYVTAATALLTAVGEPFSMDQTYASVTLDEDRTWPIDQQNTTLKIINDLINPLGYIDLYSDRDGILTAVNWSSPGHAARVTAYSTSTAEINFLREKVDLFNVPNKWVFIRDDPNLTSPTEGAGIYTVTNQSDGVSSIDSRHRTITKVERIDAASQSALVTKGDAIVDEDTRPIQKLVMTTSPNPKHWHESVFSVDAPEVALTGAERFVEISWVLPLDGGLMTHDAKKGYLTPE
jgi:hypothetical protein